MYRTTHAIFSAIGANTLAALALVALTLAGLAFVPHSQAAQGEVANFPTMLPGDSFTYMLKGRDRSIDIKRTVSKTNSDGSFVLIEETHKGRASRKIIVDPSYAASDSSGRRDKKIFKLDFPLYKGKQWKDHFKAPSRKSGKMLNFTRQYKVLKIETVKTPVGAFAALKIALKQFPDHKPENHWKGIIWYSPEVKAIIKADLKNPSRDQLELLAYNHGAAPATARRAAPSSTAATAGPATVRQAAAATQADVDITVPRTGASNPDAIAVVIGNRDYTKARPVEYAASDAESIRQYLINTLGYKEGNVFLINNALKSDFELYFGNENTHKGKLFNAIKPGRSDVFIYYSGHGAPGLKDHRGYFVPVEADPQYLELSGYSSDVFYANLSNLRAKSLTIVLDACFSGAGIFDNISPMVVEVKKPELKLNNAVVLSSSSGSQVSSWYKEKRHGMFTYFFLKAMHQMNADFNKDKKLTFDEVYRYVADNSDGVPYYARRLHGVEQNPTIEGQYKGRVLMEVK